MRAAVERDALIVGMTLVPHLYSRNKSFALFEDPEVRRARRRAAILRGIVRQLTGVQGHVEGLVVAHGAVGSHAAHGAAGQGTCELRYRVPSLHIERRASMNDAELACVRYLAGRAGVAGLHATDEDRTRIDAALRRLAVGLRLAEIEAGQGPH
jgi:hypothetical protein